MPKRPAFQWYPGDWRRDAGVQSCPLVVRGLWREVLDLMHDGEPYGHLTAGGEPIDDAQLARIVGEPVASVRRWLSELERRKVFSRTDAGVIYSRRMVRDEHARNARASGGAASTRPASPRSGATGQLFNFLLTRWGGCLWCGTRDDLELHRIAPGRKGGRYEPGNVLLLCRQHHTAMEDREFGLDEVLRRYGAATPERLFDGFTHGKWEGYQASDRVAVGNESIPSQIPSQIPSAIPPASAVAVAVASESSSHSEGPSLQVETSPRETRARARTDAALAVPPATRASSDAPPGALRWFAHFCPRGTTEPQRRRRVWTQVLETLTLQGALWKSERGRKVYVRAGSPERLSAKCDEHVEQDRVTPMRDRDKAIVVLLTKLNDTADVTEGARAEVSAELQRDERRVNAVVDEWIREHPERYATLCEEADREVPGTSEFQRHTRVAWVRSWVMEEVQRGRTGGFADARKKAPAGAG